MKNDQNNKEFVQLKVESVRRQVDKLSEAHYALHNAILTINGIFISFLSIATVVNKRISKLDILIIGICSTLPIITSLISYLNLKIGNLKAFEISDNRRKNENYLNSEKGNKKYTSMLNFGIFSSCYLKFTEIPSIILTIVSVIYIFLIVIRN